MTNIEGFDSKLLKIDRNHAKILTCITFDI